jgi:hypothetical protein
MITKHTAHRVGRGTSLALLFCLSACTSSGVLQIGPDTYTISTSNELSPALAKKRALQDAEEHCQSKGQYVMPMRTHTGSHVDSFGDNIATYDFTFRCLEEGDPDLSRPEIKDPTVNINKNIRVSDETRSGEPATNSDLYTELQKLDQLRKDGILTDDEFQQQKKKLLEKY